MSDEPMLTNEGRWVMECGGCGNVMRIKNLRFRPSVAEPCRFCRDIIAGRDDTFEAEVTQELGWCGCGSPELVDAVMLRYLSGIEGDWAARPSVYDDEALTLAAYIADDIGWTEHGTSVGGAWLTDDGREALAVLREAAKVLDR